MIIDLHSHTYYSNCSQDYPDDLIKTAIDGGINILGICDHNYGIADNSKGKYHYNLCLKRYFDHISLLKEKYKDQIIIKHGVEIATKNNPDNILPDYADLSSFDFCLIEHIDFENTIVKDIFEYAKCLNCKNIGIAHTDLKSYILKNNFDTEDFFTKMAKNNIFWELNINCDSTHQYKEHKYVYDFFDDKELQEIIRKSNVKLSVGFDSHKHEDYLPDRIKKCCLQLKELKIPIIFDDIVKN